VIDSSSKLIRAHEGLRLTPYKDSRGILTIGFGRNLERGISEDEATQLFERDLREARVAARQYKWFKRLSRARRAVVVDMQYQLGARGFSSFAKTIAALADQDFETAADEMLRSRWHEQTPARAERLSAMMRSDEWPTD